MTTITRKGREHIRIHHIEKVQKPTEQPKPSPAAIPVPNWPTKKPVSVPVRKGD